jgi:hypothetical protein
MLRQVHEHPQPVSIGIITMEAKAQRALYYEQDNIELATVTAVELKELCLRV